MTQLKPGLKFQSAVCNAEVIVIKAGGAANLSCGGQPMLAAGEAKDGNAASNSDQMGGCQIGKRYVNEDDSLELLCTKAGEGSLAADGAVLSVKDSKQLPSSD